MKVIALVLLMVVATSYAANKNPDKIIDKYSKHKGLDEVQNFQDFKISGKDSSGKEVTTFNYYFLKPNHHRLELISKDNKLKFTWSGKEGFAKSGMNPPILISGIEKVLLKSFSELIFSPIYEFQKNNYRFTNEGVIDSNGMKLFRIVKTEKSGISTDLLIDTNSYDLMETIKLYEDFESPIYCDIKLSNYMGLNNFRIPKVFTINLNDKIYKYQIDSVMFNIGLIPFDFNTPN